MMEIVKELELKILQRVGIENGHHHMTFESFDVKRHNGALLPYQIARQFADKTRGALVLYGKTGVGKTHIAVSVMRHKITLWLKWAIKQFGDNALFQAPIYHAPRGHLLHVPSFKKLLQSFWRSKSGEYESNELIKQMSQTNLLILDDLGRERKAPSFIESMDLIAEGREKIGRLTIITTNMRSVEIRERYGAAFHSRMILPATIIKMEGPDQREVCLCPK